MAYIDLFYKDNANKTVKKVKNEYTPLNDWTAFYKNKLDKMASEVPKAISIKIRIKT